MIWKPFVRQLLVGSGAWSLYFMLGLSVGFPTVLVPQLRKANFTISDETVSWLPVTPSYSGIPWLFLLAALVNAIGRKKSHIIVCINNLIGFIIYYFSTSSTHFLVGGFFHGTLVSAFLTTSVVILTEYISSQNRGIFLTFKAAIFWLGILAANALGTFFHWQKIPLLGIVFGVYTMVSVIIWPESPFWLASKGRFEECAKAHRWLKGTDKEAERELENLLKLHSNRRFAKQQWISWNGLWKTICGMQFVKPILLSSLLVCLYAFSGKLVCTVYAIDILKKITSSESASYAGMLILDGVTVVSMCFGCLISKLLKRRVMLIGFSIGSIIFMILISGYLYLAKLRFIDENKYVSIVLLAGYTISLGCGPIILCVTIIGELIPLESRSLSMCAIALIFKLTTGTLLKISPYYFRALSIHGTFTLYAVLSIVFLTLIYFYVPETSGKTLQEIDECLKDVNKKELKELVKVDKN